MPGVPGYPPTPSMQYAGWWRRVGAAILDGLIGWLFALPGFVVFLTGPKKRSICTDFTGIQRTCDVATGGTIALGLLLYLGALVAYLVIYCRMLGRGATWGRKAAGYRIVDERTGQPIGTGRAVGRYFATVLSALPCYLGFLWPLWDSENRTFHDMIVRTRAVRA
jgi:uncharacterized RDD family membrane protein YckC